MALLLLLLTISQVFAYYEAGGFGFNGTLHGKNNATVCITGTVAANTYIGFGVPQSVDLPFMISADLLVVYGNATGVHLIHGHGVGAERPFFLSDADNTTPGLPYVHLLSRQSSYNVKTSKLKACFERPVKVDFAATSGGRNLSVGVYTYLWSTGRVVDGVARIHRDAGVVEKVQLFGGLASKAH
ncbi:hypothetical protein HDU79_002913 [Rhizoclosmatium sp. JEL0117]|nr:hypothetical protein HDU79_002913 [Rhizoclosmatium sp. JEL0117]